MIDICAKKGHIMNSEEGKLLYTVKGLAIHKLSVLANCQYDIQPTLTSGRWICADTSLSITFAAYPHSLPCCQGIRTASSRNTTFCINDHPHRQHAICNFCLSNARSIVNKLSDINFLLREISTLFIFSHFELPKRRDLGIVCDSSLSFDTYHP